MLIYIHKERELGDVERRYLADHYVLVDDKPRILTAVKRVWEHRVTTVFPQQGPLRARPAGARQAAKGFVGLGRACLVLGHLDEARRLGDRAIESSPRHSGFAAHALHLLGDIATHFDRFDAESGEAYYRKALALAEPRGMRPLVAHCYLGLGKLYQRTGKCQGAHEYLTIAMTKYREMDMWFWLSVRRQRWERDREAPRTALYLTSSTSCSERPSRPALPPGAALAR